MRAVVAVFTGFMLIAPLAGAARAQTDHGALVSGLVSASVTENDTAPTVSGFVGYRFNRALGLGVELSSMWVEPFNESSLSGGELTTNPVLLRPNLSNVDGRITLFTTNVRLEIPTVFARVIPYATGGGGMANYDRSFDVLYPPLPAIIDPLTGRPITVATPQGMQRINESQLYMALTLGGGVSLLWTRHMTVDVDARCVALLGSNGGTIGRFGGGVSYRF